MSSTASPSDTYHETEQPAPARIVVEPKPSVGRIVNYWPMEHDLRENKGQPFAAVITHVWSDDCVNLHVLRDGSFGTGFGSGVEPCPTSVMLVRIGEDESRAGRWSWPVFVPPKAA